MFTHLFVYSFPHSQKDDEEEKEDDDDDDEKSTPNVNTFSEKSKNKTLIS